MSPPDATFCYKCNVSCMTKESKSDTFGYPCDLCRKIICRKCAGASATEIRVIVMASRIMPFYCPDCREKMTSLSNLIERISDLEIRIDNNHSEIKAKMTGLEQRILSLELNTSNPKHHVEPNTENFIENNFEEVIHEYSDRKERAKNVLVFNCEESRRTSPTDRIQDDKDRMIQALKDVVVAEKIRKVIRIGKQGDRPRPLKIIFDTEDSAKIVLRNGGKLINQGFKFGSDRTPQQRNFLSNLRKELERRVEAGENVTIKYVKGQPKIVPKINNKKN